MTDNELAALLRAQLLAGLTRQGYPDLEVIANYQPTTQGRPTDAAVLFHPIQDYRYGWQGRKMAYNAGNDVFDTTESQIIESGFQVYALAPQDPTNLSLPTAKDLVNLAAMICNSERFMNAMRAGGAGLQRVTQIRSPFFVNGQGNFEASPSFDVIMSHTRTITETTPVIAELEQTVNQV